MGSSRAQRWMMDAGRMALGEVFVSQALLSEVPGSRSVGYILDQRVARNHSLLPHWFRRVSSLLTTHSVSCRIQGVSRHHALVGHVSYLEKYFLNHVPHV